VTLGKQLGWASVIAIVCSAPVQTLAQTGPEISAFRKSSSSYYEIIVQGTVKDQQLVCGLKNAAGNFLASDTQYADAMVTKVLIRYAGDDVATAVCIPNQ
jgi:hypothetical protein